MTVRQRRVATATLIVITFLVTVIVFRWTWQSDFAVTPPEISTTRWEFRDDSNWFGFVTGAVRCDNVVFLADFQSKIRSVDLTGGQQLPAVAVEGPPLGLAADCTRQTLYALIPRTRGSQASVVAIEAVTGRVVRRYSLPEAFARRAYFSPPASLYIGALIHPDLSAEYRDGMPDSFYERARIGLALSLTTGTAEPLLYPYESRCIGAGACVDVALAPTPSGWVVAQPTSTQIGVYDRTGQLSRLIDIRSPGFLRTGRTLPLTASADERVRWEAQNSTIERVYSFPRHLATVHARPKIGPDWVLGQPLNFTVLMNIHAYDGTLLRADVELPDLAVGQDDEGVFVIDYGERGRTGASPVVTLSKVRIH